MEHGFSVFVAGSVVSALSIVGCSDAETAGETPTREAKTTPPGAMVDHTTGVVDHTVRAIEGDTVEALLPAEI